MVPGTSPRILNKFIFIFLYSQRFVSQNSNHISTNIKLVHFSFLATTTWQVARDKIYVLFFLFFLFLKIFYIEPIHNPQDRIGHAHAHAHAHAHSHAHPVLVDCDSMPNPPRQDGYGNTIHQDRMGMMPMHMPMPMPILSLGLCVRMGMGMGMAMGLAYPILWILDWIDLKN